MGFLHLYFGVTFAVLLAGLPWLLPGERRWAGALIERGIAWVHSRMHWSRLAALTNVEIVPQFILAVVVLGVAGLTFTSDITLPSDDLGYDTYQYHWAVPLLLLRAHGWLAFPGWAHANLPFGTEMLNLIALSLQAPQAATMIQDAFGLLTALLLFGLVRRYFGSTAAWLVVASLCTIPLLLVYTTQSYVETALVFYGVAALVILIDWLVQIGAGDPLDNRLLALAGIFLGLALSVKYTAMEYLPGVALLALVGLALYVRQQGCQASRRRVVGRMVRAVAILAGGTLLTIGPWLLKDWVLLGNPVYPALAQVFGGPEWDAARSQALAATFANFGPHSGPTARWHLFAPGLFIHPKPYHEARSFSAGSIAFAAAIAVPCAAYILWKSRRPDGLAASGRAALVVWNFSGALVERYALPGVVLVTVAGAVFIGWALRWMPGRLFLANWVIVGMLAAVLVSQARIFYTATATNRNPIPVLSGQVSEQAFQRKFGSTGLPADFYATVDYVNQRLPHDGRLLMLGRGTGYFFTNRDYVADSGGDWVPYIVSEGKTSDGMLRLLQTEGFTYVIYDANLERWLTTYYGNKLLAADLPAYLAFQQERLVLIGRWGSLSLYQVPSAKQWRGIGKDNEA